MAAIFPSDYINRVPEAAAKSSPVAPGIFDIRQSRATDGVLYGNRQMQILPAEHGAQVDGFLGLDFDQSACIKLPGGRTDGQGDQKSIMFPALDPRRLSVAVRQTPDRDRSTPLRHLFHYSAECVQRASNLRRVSEQKSFPKPAQQHKQVEQE